MRGELTLDPARHVCAWKGLEVALTVTEFLLLKALAQRPGMVKNRDQLMDSAYGEHIYVDDRTIDSHIKRLRKKFKAVDAEFGISRRCTASATATATNSEGRAWPWRSGRRDRLMPDEREPRCWSRAASSRRSHRDPRRPGRAGTRGRGAGGCRRSRAASCSSIDPRWRCSSAGLLYLDDYRRSLIDAQFRALATQGEIIAAALGEAATDVNDEEVGARLTPETARTILRRLVEPTNTHARLFAASGEIVADSRVLGRPGGQVVIEQLPPSGPPPGLLTDIANAVYDVVVNWLPRRTDLPLYREILAPRVEDYEEARAALSGEGARPAARGQRQRRGADGGRAGAALQAGAGRPDAGLGQRDDRPQPALAALRHPQAVRRWRWSSRSCSRSISPARSRGRCAASPSRPSACGAATASRPAGRAR